MHSPGLAAEVDSILKYSAVASSMTPGARQLLEEVKRKADAGSAANLFSPFQRPCPPVWGVPYVEVCGVQDRLDLVRKMSVEDLEKVVAIGHFIQRTVLLAAERRLRRLRKGTR